MEAKTKRAKFGGYDVFVSGVKIGHVSKRGNEDWFFIHRSGRKDQGMGTKRGAVHMVLKIENAQL